MFERVLIANRGEIACRIARTAHEMGLATVAVYSEPDSRAQHVNACDAAVPLGGTTPGESYLDIEKVIAAARKSGADAIHPGYGFLSENPEFARRCDESGITFIGPSAESISVMGIKSVARQTMEKAGVPVLPGYDGDNQDPDSLADRASEIGYPIMIKAVSGGGGKGMRIVEDASGFGDAIESVRRESKSAFGDDRVMLEKYLPVTRHIEFQVFADSLGNTVHLFERDCSLQRRHQKVLEEAPAPGMDAELRSAMSSAATSAPRHRISGAGTVEFLLDPDNRFYFMEMNTRLQVEHPVTEMITGLDLVEWQLRVAAGERLPLEQAEVSLHGHAVEVRIYAENPEQGFVPSTGTLHFVHQPETGHTVRVDTGFIQGDEITMHYDPMISKLVVWGENREQALTRLGRALNEYQVLGLWNNIPFLRELAASPDVRRGRYHTGTIAELRRVKGEESSGESGASEQQRTGEAAVIAACYEILRNRENNWKRQQGRADPWSPWAVATGWQNGLSSVEEIQFTGSAGETTVSIRTRDGTLSLLSDGGAMELDARLTGPNHIVVNTKEQQTDAVVAVRGSEVFLHSGGRNDIFSRLDRRSTTALADQETGTLGAPMPGTIVSVSVKLNDAVKKVRC